MSLEKTIQEIAEAFEAPTPNPDSKGEYLFTFDDVLEVRIFSLKTGGITLAANIGKEPLSESLETEKLLKKVLQWNFTRLKEYAETLTWEPDSSRLVLYKTITAAQLSETPILKHLERLLNSLEFWNKAISAEPEVTSSPLPR